MQQLSKTFTNIYNEYLLRKFQRIVSIVLIMVQITVLMVLNFTTSVYGILFLCRFAAFPPNMIGASKSKSNEKKTISIEKFQFS